MNMAKRFIEAQTQCLNNEFDLDIENPMLITIVRICYVMSIFRSILSIAEYTFTPLLIMITICV